MWWKREGGKGRGREGITQVGGELLREGRSILTIGRSQLQGDKSDHHPLLLDYLAKQLGVAGKRR